MYLKTIELKGFKSFADKTYIEFLPGITCIAGPNGSGKSNILDAVRWVLGEQSFKSLRGEKPQDIIFSGTQFRAPVGYCEAAITIDNTDGKIPIQFSEVSIRRKAYRSGENHFFINDKKCRLKDIKELLLDTGIGKEGYSIISQGRINEIINADPVHLRLLLDEASGITKLRYKKKEAEKNLQTSSENLSRIKDIFEEVQAQYKPLKQQKEKAEKYLEIYDRLKILRINQFLRENDEIRKNDLDNKAQILELGEKITVHELRTEELNKAKETFNQEMFRLQNKKAELEADREKLKVGIEEFEKNIALSNENMKNIDANKSDINAQIESLNQETKALETAKEELSKSKEVLEKELDALKKDIEVHSIVAIDFKAQLTAAREKEKNLMLEINEIQTKIAKTVTSIDFLKENIKALDDKLSSEENNTAARLLEMDRLEKEVFEKNKELEELNNKKAKIESQINKLNSDETAAKIKLNEAVKTLEAIKTNEKEIEAQNSVLEKFENQMQGFSKGVRSLMLEGKFDEIVDVAANLITVKKGYEKAVETLLGYRAENLIIKKSSDVKKLINYLKAGGYGKVTFLPMDTIRADSVKYDDKGVRAIDVISFDSKYKDIMCYLIGRNIIVDDIDTALFISKKYNHRLKIATRDGELFNIGGSITGGGQKKQALDVFSRKNLVLENHQKIQGLKKDFTEKNLDIESLNRILNDIQAQKTELEADKNWLSKTYTELESDIKNISYELKLKKESHEKIDRELSAVKQSSVEAKAAFEKNMALLEANETKKNELNEAYNLNLTEKSEIEKHIDKYEIKLSKFNADMAALEQKIISADKDFEHTKNTLNQNSDRIEQLKQKYARAEAAQENLKNEILTREEKISSFSKENQTITEQISTLFEKINELEDETKAFDKKIEESAKIKSEFDKSMFALQTQESRLFEKTQDINQRIAELYELDLESCEKFRDDELEFDETAVKSFKKELAAIGSVNLDSIEDFKKVDQRYQFYKAQCEDLDLSVKKIKDMIKSLEKFMSDDFKQSLKDINLNFEKVFKMLFNGGKAKLMLENADDILQSNIKIFVEPPGKKLNNLNILSGGEKALSAIALLFSVILCKPVPFCILDEIDAPLDDVNISRFVNLLSVLKNDTQFIDITHRRGTMQASDYIYGVTMQEKGVSKIVSVNLKDVVKYSKA